MSKAFDPAKPDTSVLRLLSVRPHQQAAIARPKCPTALLTGGRRLSPNRLARLVNDFLADPAVH